jgi:hypothetical protein
LDNKAILKQIDAALRDYNKLRSQIGRASTSRQELIRVFSALSATMDRLAPFGSQASYQFQTIFEPGANFRKDTNARRDAPSASCGLQGRISPNRPGVGPRKRIFDFLDMASYLHEQGYKDPAAVIAGSVLEEHLRNLCQKHQIPTEEKGKARKAEMLNQDLRNNNVYNLLEQKNVTAWLDLRNKAAHGDYDQYDLQQVSSLIDNVRAFIARIRHS